MTERKVNPYIDMNSLLRVWKGNAGESKVLQPSWNGISAFFIQTVRKQISALCEKIYIYVWFDSLLGMSISEISRMYVQISASTSDQLTTVEGVPSPSAQQLLLVSLVKNANFSGGSSNEMVCSKGLFSLAL